MFKNNISHNAEIVWNTLFKNGKITIPKVCQLTNIGEHHVYLALGWLCKEGKITLSTSSDCTYAEISQLNTEYFY